MFIVAEYAALIKQEASFLDLYLFIFNGIVSTKICDKLDDFDFENCQFFFFRWWCSSLYIPWSLYFLTHLIL